MYFRILMMLVGLIPYCVLAQNWGTKMVEDSSRFNFIYRYDKAQIKFGKKAIHQGFDYYNLRVRLGVACMGEGDFRSAIMHFNKALTQEPNAYDPALLLNASAVEIGLNTLDRYTQPMLGLKGKKVPMIYVEAGSKISNVQDSIGNVLFAHCGFQYVISPKITWYNALSYSNQKTLIGTVTQDQYYTHLSFKPGLLWQVNGAFSYLSVTFLPATFNGPPPLPPAPPLPQALRFDNYIQAVSISRLLGKFEVKANACNSSLNKKSQHQYGLSANYYPLGNDRLNFGMMLNVQDQEASSAMIYDPSITFRLNNHCWIKTEYLYANTSNYTEHEGFISNNNPDKTIDKTGVLLQYNVKKLELFFVYQYERKVLSTFDNSPEHNYHFNNLIFGCSFKI